MQHAQSIKPEMDMELKVYLLALNQLDERKTEENRLEKSALNMAKKSSSELPPECIGRYERNYARIEQFILKSLTKRWKVNLVRST